MRVSVCVSACVWHPGALAQVSAAVRACAVGGLRAALQPPTALEASVGAATVTVTGREAGTLYYSVRVGARPRSIYDGGTVSTRGVLHGDSGAGEAGFHASSLRLGLRL